MDSVIKKLYVVFSEENKSNLYNDADYKAASELACRLTDNIERLLPHEEHKTIDELFSAMSMMSGAEASFMFAVGFKAAVEMMIEIKN